jgi:hypothetical protein
MGNSFQALALLSMAFGIPILFKFEELWSGGIISCSGLVLGFMVKEYVHYSCVVLVLCCLLLLFLHSFKHNFQELCMLD